MVRTLRQIVEQHDFDTSKSVNEMHEKMRGVDDQSERERIYNRFVEQEINIAGIPKRDYEAKYKVDVNFLHDELISRVSVGQRFPSGPYAQMTKSAYDNLINALDIKLIANDLERLAKLLEN